MELRHLRYFVTVAEELHFGRAASRLNIAQPPLSQQIRQLENELGFPLLFRNKQRVELTEAGKVFLKECRITLKHIDRATDAAEQAHKGATGRLDIGFVGSTTYNIVPILQDYRLRFPSVNLVIHQMKTSNQLQALHDGSIHLAIVRTPIQSPFLNSKLILREKFIVALPDTHRLASRTSLSTQDLANEEFIIPSRNNGSIYHDAVINLCYKAGYQPKISMETPEILTIVAFVAAGVGVALVPASFQNQRNIGVIYRELDEVDYSLEMSFVWRKEEKSQVLQEFLKLIE
ncbi:LysR family transcriptional regulator [Paenibacillus sp.]|jgi:DNA-binding transcriptional LysR family regulator|uniref:LysR family transcriptional regulator n=1 Tax=Paenibacillus sp. TaxID=58172 RepID=UPI0028373C12|nr:LysR family transcriptional regulator [Paenibacillus sp.]MDR0270271.1 LysR family transcriptional regulator [Paenibacillus sp.]